MANLENGIIQYEADTEEPFEFGTNATHSCDVGFILLGANVRTCGGDGSSVNGEWNLFAPMCQCKLVKF